MTKDSGSGGPDATVVTFEVTHEIGGAKLFPGDVLTYHADRPRDRRLVLHRTMTLLHAGDLARWLAGLTIAPIGCDRAEAHDRLVAALVADQRARDAA